MDAAQWDDRYAQSEPVWSVGPNVFVAEVLADRSPGDAIDLAAGEGRHAVWLADLGWHVTAVDFAAKGLERATEWAVERGVTERLTTVIADVTTYQPEPDSVDVLLVAYLQLPADARRQALSNAVRAVRPGGLLVLVAHDSSNISHGTGGPPNPEVLYTAQDVLDDLATTNAEWAVVRAEVAQRDVPGADRPARDAVVVAERLNS